ncbi:hypothetical protein GAP32_050 [Cronobacter phage vB_CsaM_GAP32]|uniref:Uncharacterized protein n=1 Tax=Cronobacter phage vB_CsaM_GAP32 TaxID=1141136 RepID=K4F6F0_9CAUD|nr:hypothetical protein GAP32_050 [Cronobacter phage vB_CsaM_GAP32]AFC21498.1 hypothetical protein GAP32_050 [Cronobacter phage vB_CsaM_GAP32]
MKLKIFLELYKIFEEIYRNVKNNSHIRFHRLGRLSTGREFVISADRVYVYMELQDGNSMLDFIKITDSDGTQIHSTLRDDRLFRYPTKYATTLRHGIYRESSGVLFKAPNTFPFLNNVPMDEDVLEPLMFQLSTKYTINEVNAMVLANAFEEIHKGRYHQPGISIDFNSFDMLTDEELLELTSLIPLMVS